MVLFLMHMNRGIIMKTQLFVVSNEKVRQFGISPVKNHDYRSKPEYNTGFWTSTYDEKIGSDWIQWCIHDSGWIPRDGKWKGFLLQANKNARILHVDCFDDLKKICEKYMIPNEFGGLRLSGLTSIDFVKMANDYDGMHLTRKGQWETRFSIPSLYGWDCESTVWFRDVFDRVTRVEIDMESIIEV